MVTFLQNLVKETPTEKSCKKETNLSIEGVMIVEATLEDILSIPTSVLSMHDEEDVIDSSENVPAKPAETIECKTEAKDESKDSSVKDNKDSTVSSVTKFYATSNDVDKVNSDSSSTTVNSSHLNEGNPLSVKPDGDGSITSPNNLSSEKSSTSAINEMSATTTIKSNTTLAENNNNTSVVNDNDDSMSTKARRISVLPDNSMTSITSKVEKVLKQRNLILLESEAVGSEGSTRDSLNGPILMSKRRNHSIELSQRLLCICNIIRSLSFIPSNASTLFRHPRLMRAIAGSLLLRHKHRRRGAHCYLNDEQVKTEPDDCSKSPCDEQEEKITSSSETPLFAPSSGGSRLTSESVTEGRFCSTVLTEDERTKSIYNDPWWWDCVHQIREDALVTLCNIAHSVDLSELPDDHTALAILESCLHWSICQSSDAIDPFSHGRGR